MIQNVGGSRRFVVENVDPPDQFLRVLIPESQIVNPPLATFVKELQSKLLIVMTSRRGARPAVSGLLNSRERGRYIQP